MITLSQLSAIAGITTYRLKQYIKREELHAFKVSNVWEVTEDECDRFRSDVLFDPPMIPMARHTHPAEEN